MGDDCLYTIGKRIDDEVNEADTHRFLIIDQHSGRILHKQDSRDYTAGEKFFERQCPLHSGEAFGYYGRAFMVVLGVAPAVLYVTGFIRWRHKRRARRAMQKSAV